MRKRPVAVFLALSGTVILAACSSSSSTSTSTSASATSSPTPALTSVSIGNVSTTGPYTPVCVANVEGFFAKEGLKVDYEQATTPTQDKALLGGSLDFGTIDSFEELEANAVGGGFVMIASMANLVASSLYVSPKITSVDQLKGQSIAVGSIGTASYIAAEIELAKLGLTGEIKLTPITGGGPPVLAALLHNEVVGAQFAPPNTAEAAKEGYKELINGPTLGVAWTQGGVVTTKKFAAAHPSTVKAVATAIADAWQYMGNTANKANVISLVQKCTGTTAAAAATTYNYMIKIWTASSLPTVSEAGMETAIKYTPAAEKAGLIAADQFDNSYLPSGS